MNRPLSLAALLALPLALAACGGGGAPESTEATAVADRTHAVEVVEARPGPFEDVVELTGNVAAPEDATLGAEASGTVTYLAPLGRFVRAGAVVAQVNPSLARAVTGQAQAGVGQAQAAVAQAEAGVRAAQAQRQAAQSQLDLAQDLFSRQQPLVRDSILSPSEFRGTETQLAAARAQVAQADAGIAQAQGQVRAAQAGLRAAQAGLQQAQTSLGNTRIVAPFSGTVEVQLVERGETVGPGTPVVRLVSSGGLLVEAGVPERYAGDVGLGTAVRIRTGARSDDARGGRVTFVGRAVDPATRTFPIEIQLDGSDGPLRPSMVVRLDVSRAVMSDVIAVPTTALVRDERGTGVLVVVAEAPQANAPAGGQPAAGGHVARYQPVEVGTTGGGRAVVTRGLDSGALVVADARTGVREGDRVRIAGRRDADEVAEAR